MTILVLAGTFVSSVLLWGLFAVEEKIGRHRAGQPGGIPVAELLGQADPHRAARRRRGAGAVVLPFPRRGLPELPPPPGHEARLMTRGGSWPVQGRSA